MPSSGSGSDHGHSQPPLKPTSFLKDDGGALIAVYPQDALHQYMSSSGQPRPQSTPPSGISERQVHGLPPSVSGWTQYVPGPHTIPVYPYPYPPSVPLGPSSTQQSLLGPGQYPPNTWISSTTIPACYPPPNLPQPNYPLYSASSGNLAAAPSLRNGFPVPSLPTQPDLGHASNRSTHPTSPKRFDAKSQATLPPYLHRHSGNVRSLSQPLRGVVHNSVGNDSRGLNASRSPPALSRRESGIIDAPSGFPGDGPGHGKVHSSSQQYASQMHQQHSQMRASGSYPTVLAPNGPLAT
jgi:hypothetical protein